MSVYPRGSVPETIHSDCASAHSFAKYANEWGPRFYLGHPSLEVVKA